MASIGEAKFNKVVSECGGYVWDDNWIKYLFPYPINSKFQVLVTDIKMQFAVKDKNKLVSRLHIWIYEPTAEKKIAVKNLKAVHFNYKVYMINQRLLVKQVMVNNKLYDCYHMILNEV